MGTHTIPSAVVKEVLGHDNYDKWSASMKSYMKDENLLDIIDEDVKPPNQENCDAAWGRRNKMVLHAMRNSCDPQLLSEISDVGSARYVWYHLARKFGNDERQVQVNPGTASAAHNIPNKPQASEVTTGTPSPTLRTTDELQVLEDHAEIKRRKMVRRNNPDELQRPKVNAGARNDEFAPHLLELNINVVIGDCETVKGVLARHPDVISARISKIGGTALREAARLTTVEKDNGECGCIVFGACVEGRMFDEQQVPTVNAVIPSSPSPTTLPPEEQQMPEVDIDEQLVPEVNTSTHSPPLPTPPDEQQVPKVNTDEPQVPEVNPSIASPPRTIPEEPQLPQVNPNIASPPLTIPDKLPPVLEVGKAGDWRTVKGVLARHPDAIRARISIGGGTALHQAVLSKKVDIAKKLTKLMSKEDLEIRDNNGNTALYLAAAFGTTKLVEYMIRKNPKLVTMGNKNGALPLEMVCWTNQRDLARCLYSITPPELLFDDNGKCGSKVLDGCVAAGMFDMALDILCHSPSSDDAMDIIKKSSLLKQLSTLSEALPSGNPIAFWRRRIYYRINIQPFVPSNGIRVYVSNQRGSRSKNIMLRVLERLQKSAANRLDFLGIKKIYDLKLEQIRLRELLDYVQGYSSNFDVSANQEMRVAKAFNNAVK